MRVLVCGGRYGCESVESELSALHADIPFSLLIHGGATGVDSQAGCWAYANQVPIKVYRAAWRKPDGTRDRSAGPRRNARMLHEEQPDLVVAFPGGKGTADMVRRAKAADVPVMEVT